MSILKNYQRYRLTLNIKVEYLNYGCINIWMYQQIILPTLKKHFKLELWLAQICPIVKESWKF